MRALMERQAFLCPLCNTPHNEELQPGTLQVKCKYCGGAILVPSRLSGLYIACPDHPESQSVGLCTSCGRSCCERCLYVMGGPPGATQYLCPQCINRALAKWTSPRPWDCLIGLSLVIIACGIAFLVYGSGARAIELSLNFMFWGVMLLACGLRGKTIRIGLPPTLREKRQEEERALKGSPGFTWAQCPHCGASYFYDSARIMSDRTVLCQNCDRRFSLAE